MPRGWVANGDLHVYLGFSREPSRGGLWGPRGRACPLACTFSPRSLRCSVGGWALQYRGDASWEEGLPLSVGEVPLRTGCLLPHKSGGTGTRPA